MAICILAVLRGVGDIILIFLSYGIPMKYVYNYSLSNGNLGKYLEVLVVVPNFQFHLQALIWKPELSYL